MNGGSNRVDAPSDLVRNRMFQYIAILGTAAATLTLILDVLTAPCATYGRICIFEKPKPVSSIQSKTDAQPIVPLALLRTHHHRKTPSAFLPQESHPNLLTEGNTRTVGTATDAINIISEPQIGADFEYVVNDDDHKSVSTLIVRVAANGLAAKAGLEAGDVVVSYEGVPAGGWTIERMVTNLLSGRKVETRILRNGATMELLAAVETTSVEDSTKWKWGE